MAKMAQELDDGEFWLPPEFLNDDDILMDFKLSKPNMGEAAAAAAEKRNSGLYSLYGFDGFGSNSDLSSPVESVMGSTETESDDEEYLSGLTRKLARSTLYDDFWKPESNFNYESNNTKATRVVAGSPQSTLCGCKQGSSRGSPNCPSPPNAAARNRESSLDLLYAAAGEVARMRMVEEATSGYYKRSYLASQPPPRKTISPQSLQYQQIQAAAQLRQQQMMKQQQYHQMLQQNRAKNGGGGSNRAPAPALPLSAWPTLQQSQQPQHQQLTQPQQQPGSGMRAVFLGNPTTKRECTGTGVFLPRQVGAPTEPRKKRGCSTVLLPDRVVQALNLNLEAMEAQAQLQSRCNGPHFTPDYDAELRYRTSLLMSQQRRNNVRQQPVMNELRLPQEWTY